MSSEIKNNPNRAPEGMEIEVITYPDGSQFATFVPKKGGKAKASNPKDDENE